MFTSHELLGGILLLITPAGFLAFLHFLLHGRTAFERFHAVEGDRGRREYLFAFCMVLVPLSVFFAFSLGKEVKLNWTGPLWLGLLPYMALTMRDLGRRVAVDGFIRWMRRLWPATALLLLLLYAAGLHYVTLGLPAVPPVPGPFQTGRRELAIEVEKIVARVEAGTGHRPLVVGMDPYQLASSLAFYRRGDADHPPGSPADRAIDETLAWHVFGWKGLMYAYWFPPASLTGRDMLLIASSRDVLRNAYFDRYVSKIHNIREIPVSRNGRPLTSYYYRLVRGYQPWPDVP